MPGLKALFSLDSTPFKSGMEEAQRVARKSGHSIASDLVAPTIQWRLAMREVLVLLREIGRGNWNRVPGSLSLLLQSLGAFKMLLNPVAAGLAAVGAAAYQLYNYFADLAEGEGTLYKITGAIGDRFKYVSEAMEDAAHKTRQFNEWLSHIGPRDETLNESIRERLRLMDREYELRQKQAEQRGANPAQLEAQRLAHLRDRAKFLEQSAEAAKQEMWNRADAAQHAFGQFSPADEGRLRDIQARRGQAADLMAKAQDAFKEQVGFDPQGVSPGSTYNYRLDIAGRGKVEYGAVVKTFEALDAQAKALEARRDKRDTDTERARQKADEASRTFEQLNREAREAGADADLEAKYPDRGRAHIAHGYVNSSQSVGAYAAPAVVALIDPMRKTAANTLAIKTELQNIHKTIAEKKSYGLSGAKL